MASALHSKTCYPFFNQQVLESARLNNPYMDTYYHKRDHSLLLALHNPVGPNNHSMSSWSTKLHSNVGFRNYLEHVVNSIGDWVREQVCHLWGDNYHTCRRSDEPLCCGELFRRNGCSMNVNFFLVLVIFHVRRWKLQWNDEEVNCRIRYRM